MFPGGFTGIKNHSLFYTHKNQIIMQMINKILLNLKKQMHFTTQ